MEAILLGLHVLLALALIGLVLLQHGKGAEVGASFGSGASSTVFGASGSASFLTKLTTIIAVIFFASSLALAYLSAKPAEDISLIDNITSALDEPIVDEEVIDEETQSDLPVIEESVGPELETPESGDSTQPADVPAIEE